MMLASWGALIVRRRRLVLAAGIVLIALSAVVGRGVFAALVSGGFDDPRSESARTSATITAAFGPQDADVIAVWRNPAGTAQDPVYAAVVRRAAQQLRSQPQVAQVTDYADTGDHGLVSADGRASLVRLTLRPRNDSEQRTAYNALRPLLSPRGVVSSIGGPVAVADEVDTRTKTDVGNGERIALPVVLVLLMIVFGSVTAAALPVAVGLVAVLGALAVTRLITLATDVSTFAVNSITLLGLGMAIDYALLMVSRFREQLAEGHTTALAVQETVATAGRTVLVSAATVALSLASLLVFPQVFLHSMAWGGMAAVAIAGTCAVTVLPALLALLGSRVNAGQLPWLGRRSTGKRWARLAANVMARPVRYLAGALVVLLFLAAPVAGLRLGPVDDRVLPPGNAVRATATTLHQQFPAVDPAPIDVLLTATNAQQLQPAFELLQRLPGIAHASMPVTRGRLGLVAVHVDADVNSTTAKAVVRELRHLKTPGTTVAVTGQTASAVDQIQALRHRLPWMLGLAGLVTFVLLTAAFRAPVLAGKAVLVNLLSISASFGVLVWGFQHGHLSGPLNFTATGYLEPTVLILVLAILFGLATDYEVFLLGRVREEWLATSDNTGAVAAALRSTGPLITAAALLLIVVAAGFASGDVVVAKLIGVGMMVAIALDATVVRGLLVPATMRLLGRINWWTPRRGAPPPEPGSRLLDPVASGSLE